tara:strand:+ start:1290 stop:1577 length:288 start_codon:yes stop_codon:yes gene_type:complete
LQYPARLSSQHSANRASGTMAERVNHRQGPDFGAIATRCGEGQGGGVSSAAPPGFAARAGSRLSSMVRDAARRAALPQFMPQCNIISLVNIHAIL